LFQIFIFFHKKYQNICPEGTICIPDSSKYEFSCKCSNVKFFGLEGKIEKAKTIVMENFSSNSTNPVCLPVQETSKRSKISLKSTTTNQILEASFRKPFPYGVLYEFIKLEIGKEAIKRETRRPDAIDKILERQDKLLKGLMGDIDRGWRKKCGPRCEKDVCTLEEIRFVINFDAIFWRFAFRFLLRFAQPF